MEERFKRYYDKVRDRITELADELGWQEDLSAISRFGTRYIELRKNSGVKKYFKIRVSDHGPGKHVNSVDFTFHSGIDSLEYDIEQLRGLLERLS